MEIGETNNNQITQFLESELITKYKSSYQSAFKDLTLHLFIFNAAVYLIHYFKDSYMSIFTVPLLSLMIVRSFIVFHDCGHDSYTPNKILNTLISDIFGIFAITSSNWTLDHHIHHLTNGNIENKYHFNFNETVTNSLSSYEKKTKFSKMVTKLIYNPFTFFSLFPFLHFFIMQRFSYIVKKLKYGAKINDTLGNIFYKHILNNIGIGVLLYTLNNYGIMFHYLIATYFSTIMAFVLFFNQHTFNPAYVVGNSTWTQRNCGIQGSSFIQIHQLLEYFTMGIEYHHVHHINSRIPGYNTQKYHEDVIQNSPLFDNVTILSGKDCIVNLWLMLYDDKHNKYITFAEGDKMITQGKVW
jgi:omega-6 fatty acid desaturase (delta-12 desaturase)